MKTLSQPQEMGFHSESRSHLACELPFLTGILSFLFHDILVFVCQFFFNAVITPLLPTV